MTQLVPASFGDPQSLTKLALDAELLVAQEPEEPPAYLVDATAATELPAVAPKGRLLVVSAGPWTSYQHPLTAVQRLRVVAYAPLRDEALDLASWAHARLLSRRQTPAMADETGQVHSWRYEAGPQAGKDPDFPDTPIAAFSILARMRPAIV